MNPNPNPNPKYFCVKSTSWMFVQCEENPN